MSNGDIQDIYQLSPMQQGMLFHSLYAPDACMYIQQDGLILKGDLNTNALQRAWQHVMDRHPILRTSFHWEDLKSSLQVVHRGVALPWKQLDWRSLSQIEQQEQLEAFLQADQKQGFKLDMAPLFRVTLIRQAEDMQLLIWTQHHLLLDGWSVSLVLKEIQTCYQSFLVEQLPQLPYSYLYRNYIAWLQQQDLATAEIFWKRELKGFSTPTHIEIGMSSKELSLDAAKFDEQHLSLSLRTTVLLQRLANEHQLTLNTLIQGVWALLLSRYSGEEDVAFGVIVSGRPETLVGIETMVGLFINTLPVRVAVSPQAPLLPWLKRLQAGQIEAHQFEYCPLVQIQEWSEIQAPIPLFESVLVFQNYFDSPSSQEKGAILEWQDNSRELWQTNYPLVMMVVPDKELFLQISYDMRRFNSNAIKQIMEHMRTVLEGMISNSEVCLGKLSLLTASEQQRILVDWNATYTPYFRKSDFSMLFEEQIKQTPDRIALVTEEHQISYAELDKLADRLSAELRKKGVGPDTLVAVLSERAVTLFVAILAVFKVRGAYLPLDPDSPIARQQQILIHSGSSVAVVSAACSAMLSQALVGLPTEKHPVVVNIEESMLREEDEQEQPISSSPAIPEQLAYVLYTSGSTGVPKGVMIDQRSMLNHLHSAITYFQLNGEDIIAQTAPQSYVVSIWQMLAALLVGGRVHVISNTVVRDVLNFPMYIEQYQITLLEIVPSLLQAILQGFKYTQAHVPPLKALRWVISTGEALPLGTCQLWFAQYPQIPLVNAYGSTECADDVTYSLFTCPPLTYGAAYAPLGKPLANKLLYVLDHSLEPVPVGVSGELYVGGIGVGRGYLADAVRTAETFIADPFNPVPGARMYKTGDAVFYQADGTIEYLGRLDTQIKIRGRRIEPGEIEAVISQHPDVRQCVVLPRENVAGEKQLIAYVQSQRPSTVRTMQHMKFSLFFFAADDTNTHEEKYRLYVDSAKFADEHGFTAIWTPERHFHEVAGPYPNPSVLSAALAMVTKRIQLRAGSVVLPLHHPLRVAEEWAVVDNLSGGRVGLSFTSGWVPNDFAFYPEHFENKRDIMFRGIEQVQELWRGEAILVRDGLGNNVSVRTFPRPIQQDVPIWLTCTSDPAMFIKAGEMGLHVLTALLDMSIEEAAKNIALYRDALERSGYDPHSRSVTMMLHTYLGMEYSSVLEKARVPFCHYMKSHIGLIKTLIKSLNMKVDAEDIKTQDMLASFAFDHYVDNASLIGTPKTKSQLVEHLAQIGVDEIACLIDFGIAVDEVLENLQILNGLKEQYEYNNTIREESVKLASTHESLQAFLQRKLPNYMLPAVLVHLETFPLLSNGKIDRQALSLAVPITGPEIEFTEPRTPTEKMLAEIWSDLLGIRQISIHDDFFKLGGHSLLAMQLIVRIRSHLSVNFEVRQCFGAPTLEAMAQVLEEALFAQLDGKDLDRLLDMLESTTEEEIQKNIDTIL